MKNHGKAVLTVAKIVLVISCIIGGLLIIIQLIAALSGGFARQAAVGMTPTGDPIYSTGPAPYVIIIYGIACIIGGLLSYYILSAIGETAILAEENNKLLRSISEKTALSEIHPE